MKEEKQDRRSKVVAINDVANEVVLRCIRGRESYRVKESKMEVWWHGGINEVRWDVKGVDKYEHVYIFSLHYLLLGFLLSTTLFSHLSLKEIL
jgi:hypothetical protein